MEWTTIKSTGLPAGRGPWLGDSTRTARFNQPSCQVASEPCRGPGGIFMPVREADHREPCSAPCCSNGPDDPRPFQPCLRVCRSVSKALSDGPPPAGGVGGSVVLI
jgi:hypothetical protein